MQATTMTLAQKWISMRTDRLVPQILTLVRLPTRKAWSVGLLINHLSRYLLFKG